jgi:hypothetical protein
MALKTTRDSATEIIAFAVYYAVVCGVALAGVLLWFPVIGIGKAYDWAKRRAPLEQK